MTDSTQASLFDRPAPYRRGSDTSREAAEKVTPAITAMEARVLAAYEAAGPRGLTPSECADATGLSILSVRPRVCCMKDPRRRVLVETTERRRNHRGNNEYVCRVPA